MFPRRKRLNRSEFTLATRSGRRISSANFSAVIPKDAEGYAVVVSKKTARLSVTRHRIKRKVLEALKTLLLPPSLIIFTKQSATGMKYQEIKTELEELLSKIKK